MIILLLAALCLPAAAQQDSLLVMFWNLENFFDCRSDGPEAPDREFSPLGAKHWTRRRFRIKCNAVCKTILLAADSFGKLPDAIGFAEIENRDVLEDLILETPLRKLGYRIVHYDSHDHRGIDCALLYRKSTLGLTDSKPLHLYGTDGEILPTRDILLARFGGFAILVNHHPSKVGEGSSQRRGTAMERMDGACDSLRAAGVERVLCIGDFNEDLWDSGHSSGTIKYEGQWEKIDGCFLRGPGQVRESVFDHPSLLTKDAAYGGTKPLRTYSGPRWLGGVSDHLPILIKVAQHADEPHVVQQKDF